MRRALTLCQGLGIVALVGVVAAGAGLAGELFPVGSPRLEDALVLLYLLTALALGISLGLLVEGTEARAVRLPLVLALASLTLLLCLPAVAA